MYCGEVSCGRGELKETLCLPCGKGGEQFTHSLIRGAGWKPVAGDSGGTKELSPGFSEAVFNCIVITGLTPAAKKRDRSHPNKSRDMSASVTDVRDRTQSRDPEPIRWFPSCVSSEKRLEKLQCYKQISL